MVLTIETAKVFKAGNRRFFTKKAALNHLAWRTIRRRCDCSSGDAVTPGETCRYHAMEPNRFCKLKSRLARLIARRVSIQPQH